MIKKIFRYAKIIISFYFIYFFIDYTFKNKEKLTDIFYDSISVLILVIILKIIIVLLNSIIFRKIVRLLGIGISFPLANELTILNYLGNLVGPLKLGAGMRIEYLRQNYKVNIKNFIIKNFNLTLYTQIIYISIFVFALYIDNKINTYVFLIIFTTILLSLYIFCRNKIFGKENIFSIKDFISNVFFNLSILGLFFIGFLIVILEINLVINDSFQLIKGVYVFEGISLTNIANLTPANLGIREFALLSINSLHGLSLNDLVEVGIIDRFCSLFSTFLMFLFQSFKKSKNKSYLKNNEVQ